MSKPAAVLISDLHFNLNNLQVASHALQMALLDARALNVPLIIAGDLQDTKAVVRAEVMNELISLQREFGMVKVALMVGNHDLINEKGYENALNYLNGPWTLIDTPTQVGIFHLIPYQSDISILTSYLTSVPKGTPLIMHQGFKGAFMGEYVQDKSSIAPTLLEDFRVFSGHYHRHQTVGILSHITYIGTPYTTSFAEANDPEKGYLIVNDDLSYVRKSTNLRKHIIYNVHTSDSSYNMSSLSDDLVYVKISGPKSELDLIDKDDFGLKYLKRLDYKLEKIPDEINMEKQEIIQVLTVHDRFDNIIDALPESYGYKMGLRDLWRNVYED